MFYGHNEYGAYVYKLFVVGGLLGGINSVIVNTLQGLSKYKLVIICVLTGLLLNTILDVPLMLLMNKLNMEVSYGAIIAAMIGYGTSAIMALIVLNRKYKFSFMDTAKKLPSYIFAWTIFTIVIIILKLFIPTDLTGRLIQLPILCAYGIISFTIYLIINHFFGNLKILKEIRKEK